jgi:hypothetical protein
LQVRNHLRILSDIQAEVPADATGNDLSGFLQQMTEQKWNAAKERWT